MAVIPDSAQMITTDTLFPSYDKPVNLFSMPSAAYIDVDNNAINDLILSPFDPGLDNFPKPKERMALFK